MLPTVATFDKKKSLLNVSSAVVAKILLLGMSFGVRRCLIVYGSAELGGLAALFGDIIGLLGIVECGIGSVILFHLYQPLVEGDDTQVAALYNLCRKVYRIIALVVLGLGLLAMPLLPLMVKAAGDYPVDVNLYVNFGLFLVTSCIGYLFRAPAVLVDAHKNNCVNTTIQGISVLIGQTLQIVALTIWHSFTLYLAAAIVNALVNWLLLTLFTRRHYRPLMNTKAQLDPATGQAVKRNVKAMTLFQVKGIINAYLDNIIVALMLGLITRNAYANYIMIMESLSKLSQLCLSPLTAIVGHYCVKATPDEKHKYFQFMYLFNFALYMIFMLGFYAVIDPLIDGWLGAPGVATDDLHLSHLVVWLLTVNNLVAYMIYPVRMFWEVTGTFAYNRWQPVVQIILLLVFSPLLTWWLGIVGFLLNSMLVNLTLVHLVKPYYTYRHVFKRQPTKYYWANYGLILLFTATLGGLHALLVYVVPVLANPWLQFLVNGCVAVAIGGGVLLLLLAVSPTVRQNVARGLRALRSRRKVVKP